MYDENARPSSTEPRIDWWHLDAEFEEISKHYFKAEPEIIKYLVSFATPHSQQRCRISNVALELIEIARECHSKTLTIERFLREYRLDTAEGAAIMCLAEALIRIPDETTRREFIRDKLKKADWQKYIGQSDSFWVNASTWGLVLSGKLFKPQANSNPSHLSALVNKLGSPVVEKAILQAIEVISQQFIYSESIEAACKKILAQPASTSSESAFSYSVDMLGEAAVTASDAQQYFKAYLTAIETLGKLKEDNFDHRTYDQPNISIKLSALTPRFEWTQPTYLDELYDRTIQLVELAQLAGVGITFDAEESFRLEITLKLFKAIFKHPKFKAFSDIGLAVQAYQKRAYPTLEWLKNLSQETGKSIPIRLVKGAYWDSEIKWAQHASIEDYPVFTQKAHTDISYLACARFLIENSQNFYPEFATHNAHTIASILVMTKDAKLSNYEFQRLHGMGETIYDHLVESNLTKKYTQLEAEQIHCRIYAPIGSHKDLLPYLVRRLLENGASTSFVHHLHDPNIHDAELVYEPADAFHHTQGMHHPNIPLVKHLFGQARDKATAIQIESWQGFEQWRTALTELDEKIWESQPSLPQLHLFKQEPSQRFNPANPAQCLGEIYHATPEHCDQAIKVATQYQPEWAERKVKERANLLLETAIELEKEKQRLAYLLIHEAGKTWKNAQNEIIEAIDFLRYYAQLCLEQQYPLKLKGPTGEENQLILEPLGTFCCISPWNFPVSIFVGQIAAALVTGNTVIAKPAESAELVAYQTVQCFYRAGISKDALVFLPIKSTLFNQKILSNSLIGGVAFTGSNLTAQRILNTLAQREKAPLPQLISETGGLNAMIVDSTALPEQVVLDVVQSAFDSAGQRCSALRVLFLQDNVADVLIEKIKGRMRLLKTDNPRNFSTDIGPIIHFEALNKLKAYLSHLKQKSKNLYQSPLDEKLKNTKQGFFFPPTLVEIDKLSLLKEEAFGPILHVIRYSANSLDEVIEQINESGFGLTLGIHSRINEKAKKIATKIKVGNVYINRDMIGAQVGVQPFGGQGLSGTGPKAGGPHYLKGFTTEKTITNNITAIGGNTQLLANSGSVKKAPN